MAAALQGVAWEAGYNTTHTGILRHEDAVQQVVGFLDELDEESCRL